MCIRDSLTAPDGTEQTVEIVKKAGVDGIYESTNHLPTPLDLSLIHI